MSFWHRLVIAAAVFVVSLAPRARSSTGGSSRRPLAAGSRRRATASCAARSRVAILVVGFFSALLVIPQVRAVAGGLLASSAVLGVIIGFASQRTLGNFVAGLLIAITQPVRLGDRVTYDGEDGVIEEIGLTYTFIRTAGRGAARRPERETRLRYHPQLLDPQPGDVRRDHRAGPAFSRSRRRGRRASRRGRATSATRRST